MSAIRRLGIVAAMGVVGLLGVGSVGAGADPYGDGNGGPGDHGAARAFRQTNLISDIDGVARITDPNLVNPWGMAAGPTTPLWIADNGTDVSTLYTGGVRGSIPVVLPLVVTIPDGAPTGIVFNPTTGFVVDHGQRRARRPTSSSARRPARSRPGAGPCPAPRRRSRAAARPPSTRAWRSPPPRRDLPLRRPTSTTARIDVFDNALRAGDAVRHVHRSEPPGGLRAVQHPATWAASCT